MKKLVALLSLVATVSAFSQGQIIFNNLVPSGGVNAPIGYGAGGPVTAGALVNVVGASVPFTANGVAVDFSGANARAALYFGHIGDAASSLQILTPSVPFKTGSLLGIVNVTSAMGGQNRTLPAGYPAGSGAIFQVRAWDTGLAPANNQMSYEDAIAMITARNGGGYAGVSDIVTINSLTVSPTTPGPLVGLQGFNMTWIPVPEPSIIGLGILGSLAGLFVFRRRN